MSFLAKLQTFFPCTSLHLVGTPVDRNLSSFCWLCPSLYQGCLFESELHGVCLKCHVLEAQLANHSRKTNSGCSLGYLYCLPKVLVNQYYVDLQLQCTDKCFLFLSEHSFLSLQSEMERAQIESSVRTLQDKVDRLTSENNQLKVRCRGARLLRVWE